MCLVLFSWLDRLRMGGFDRRRWLWSRGDCRFPGRRCLGGLRLTVCTFKFDQRLPDFQVVALTNEQACDFPGGRCRHRHGGFIGLQLDQRLSLGHLIALVDQDLDDVAPLDAFCEKRQFHSHGS